MITSRQLIRKANATYRDTPTAPNAIRSRLIVLESCGKLNARHDAERTRLISSMHHIARLDNTYGLSYIIISDSPTGHESDSFLGDDGD